MARLRDALLRRSVLLARLGRLRGVPATERRGVVDRTCTCGDGVRRLLVLVTGIGSPAVVSMRFIV
jgi:hypothetical protein